MCNKGVHLLVIRISVFITDLTLGQNNEAETVVRYEQIATNLQIWVWKYIIKI